MQTINPQDNTNLIHWAASLADLMKERGRGDIAAQIEELIQSLKNNSFSIAVIGKAKRGKSTLINALLGRQDDDLAPIDRLPASSTITRFRWAKDEKVTVFYRDGRQETIPPSSIRDYVTEEGNPGNRRGVNLLVVEGPYSNLENGVELVDTPGAGSIHEYHDSLLHGFIPQADAIIFLVTARMPFDKDELELLAHVKNADIRKIFFVINRVDESEEEDIQNAITHNENLLREHGVSCQSFYRISAKQAFQGNFSQSGVDSLVSSMNTFMSGEKNQLIRLRFVTRIMSLVESESQVLQVALVNAQKSDGEIENEIRDLQRQVKEMQQTREYQEREFELGWDKAVNEFANALLKAERTVQAQIDKKMDGYTSLGVSKLAKELPTIISQTIEQELEPHSTIFEKDVHSLCEKLQSAYPVLDITDTGNVVLHVKGQGGIVNPTAAAGTLGAVAGVTLVQAGTTVAAGIASANAAALAATSAAASAATATAAAATAAAETSVITSIFATIAGWLGLGTGAAGATGAVVTGTAVTGTTTLAYTTTPLWVAISGPVGWTVAGVGALAIPFAWRCSKLRQKNQLTDEADKQVAEIFHILKTERIEYLKAMKKTIVDEFHLNLDAQVAKIQDTLQQSKERIQPGEVQKMERQMNAMKQLLGQASSLETC